MEKDLNYWKKSAEEDYMNVPISVLRYITELEKAVLPQADVMVELPENHVCRYSKAMNQPYPRLCIDCGKPEGN